MKTIQVINVRWHNATAWYALNLARLLEGAGHETLILALPGTECEAVARGMGLNVQAVDLNSNNPTSLARECLRAARLVKDFAPDVVNCHRGEAFFFWGLMRALGGSFKLVRTRGDQRPPKADPFNRWLHSRASNAVVATNRAMARHFLERMRLPQKKLWLIHGGVDTERFAPDPEGGRRVRAEYGFTGDDFVIGLVGRFDLVKGQKELIQAVARMRRDLDMDKVKLLLAGFESATTQAEVEGWIREAGLDGAARITGRRRDLPAVVSAMDTAVVASLYSETIARTAMEIMAVGTPLVSTSVGVMPDLLTEKALIPPSDVPALIMKLVEAAKHERFRRELAREQSLAMSQLTDEQFVRRTLSLYQGIIEEDSALKGE